MINEDAFVVANSAGILSLDADASYATLALTLIKIVCVCGAA